MEPVSQFKFACPVCGQHLQARAEEAGQTTECPSCFKKLIVPQAPTDGGGKLIITASLAETRRVPVPKSLEPGPAPVRPVSSSRGPFVFILLAFVVVTVALGGFLVLKRLSVGEETNPDPVRPQLWTDNADELQLLDSPAAGRLNGWEFELTEAVWRDTRLILRQNGKDPEALRLVIIFPLKGGELVSGKTFRLGLEDPPFVSPPRIVWKNEAGKDLFKLFASGYVLRAEFGEVSKTRVSGQLHICFPDPAKSWVAGSFSAENKTEMQ